MTSRIAEKAPRRPKRLNVTTVLVLLVTIAFAFTLRHHLALSVANATGQTTVHSARVTAISDSPWRALPCRQDSGQKSYDIHVQWSEPEPGGGSYRLCLKDHERRAMHVGQTQQVMSEPWLGSVKSCQVV